VGGQAEVIDMPSELQACVSDKVGTLIDEGYERDQALAIAYSKCREGKSKAVDEDDELDAIVKMHGGNLEAIKRQLATVDKMVMRPTQAEAVYVSLSAKKGQACANCRFFDSHMSMCALIENYPDDIVLTGWCSRWEARPVMPSEHEQLTVEAESVTINPPMMSMGEMAVRMADADAVNEPRPETTEKVGRVLNKKNETALRSIMASIKDILVKAGIMEMEDDEDMPHKSAFSVFKANGQYYWSAMWSNNFVDRDDEILTEKAHEKYIARLRAGFVPMPVLRYWHIPGTEHGKALWVGGEGHMMLAVGDFEDTDLARAFIKEYRTHRKKVSHGFRFPDWAKRPVQLTEAGKSVMVYDDYNTFEISPLPPHVAANLLTDLEVDTMKVNEEIRADLERIIGKVKTDGILTKAQEASKDAEKEGHAYKDFADLTTSLTTDKDAAITAMAKAFLSMIDDQSAIAERQDKLDAANKVLADEQTALKAVNEKLLAENADLKDKLKHTPRASTSPATAVDDEDTRKALEARGVELDPLWAKVGLKVAKKEKSNHG